MSKSNTVARRCVKTIGRTLLVVSTWREAAPANEKLAGTEREKIVGISELGTGTSGVPPLNANRGTLGIVMARTMPTLSRCQIK